MGGLVSMHPYTIQSARWRVIGMIMLAAVVISPLLQYLITQFESVLSIQVSELFLISGLPTFFIFTALYILFNNSAWCWPIIHRFVAQPDLNGTWMGGLESSYQTESKECAKTDGGEEQLPCLDIEQTWSHIEIVLETENSMSHSTSATFRTRKAFPELVLTYVNKPKREPATELNMHEGTNTLRVTEEDDQIVLEGEYYTDEKRNNHGRMHFTRLEDNHSN